MSPAIVDFGTPGVASSKAHTKRSSSQNRMKGQTPAPPSPFLFDPTGSPATDRPSAAASFHPMDRASLGHSVPGSGNSTDGGFNSGFASPAPSFPPSPFPSVSASGKAAGLSKPRLVKVRKHFASPRVRPTVAPEARDAAGFNPFRAGPAASPAAVADQMEVGGTRGLNEKLHSWKPFNSESGIRVPESSSGPNLSGFESVKSESGGFVFGAGSASKRSGNIGSKNGKDHPFSFGGEGSRGSDAGLFVFGSGVKKSSDLGLSSKENLSGPNSGSFEYVKSENSFFVFGAGSASNQSAKNIGSGNTVDRACSFGSEGSVGSETGVFVFARGVNMRSDSRRNSPENSSGRNLGNSESVKFESADIIFGASSVSNSNKPDHTFNFVSKNSSNFDPAAFVPGSGLEKSPNLSHNLLGNLTALNMGGFKTGNSESTAFVFTANAGSFSDTRNVGSESVVGAASDFMKEGSGKSDSGVFVFGSGTQKDASSGQNSLENSGILNLGGCESVKPEDANFIFGTCSTSNLGSKTLVSEYALGGEFSFGGGRSGNSDTGLFVFGNGMKKSSNLSQTSSIDSEQGQFLKHPDEMRKLNLQSSSSEEGFEKIKHADNKAKVNQSNVFVFGGNQNAPSSIAGGGAVNILPEEMKALNRESATASKNTKDESVDQTANVFVFGSNMKESSASSQTLANSFTSFEKSCGNQNAPSSIAGGGAVNILPEEMKTLNRESGTASKNTKDDSVDQTANVFVFGSNMKKSSASSQTLANSFTSFEKSCGSDLPNHIQKLNAEGLRNDNNFAKTENTDYQFKVDVGNGPNGFTFQSNKDVSGSFEGNGINTLHNDIEKLDNDKPEKQGINSMMGHVPPSKTQEYLTSCGIPTSSFSPSLSGPGFQSVGTEFTFTSMHGGLKTPHTESRTHKQDDSGLSKENLFTGPHPNMAFNIKKGDVKSTRTKKRIGKSKQSVPAHQTFAKPFISVEECSLEHMKVESPGGYSPMDYSPYQENLVDNQCSREASVASGESLHIFSCCASTDAQRSFSVDGREEGFISSTRCLDINEDDLKQSNVERSFVAKSSVIDEQSSVPSRESFVVKSDSVGHDGNTNNAVMEAGICPSSSNFERQGRDRGTSFTFATSPEDRSGLNFTFAASPFAQGSLAAAKHHYRRRSRMKTGQDLYNSTSSSSAPLASPSPSLFSVTGTSVQPDPAKGLKSMPSSRWSGDDNRAETNRKPGSKKEDTTKNAASIAALEACDKWRLRGNRAYANGHLSKAEENYTCGVNSISPNETSRNCSRALMLCYNSRAATRMSLGRMREALNDCMMAVAIDSSFRRAQLRAANCHLVLGETEDALKHFKKCLKSDDDASLDKKILLEASEGLQKAQLVGDYIVQARAHMLKRTPNEVTKALQLVSEALLISPHSENLMEMKAEALLMLRNYEEVIQLCEQSVDSAEKNSFLAGSDDQFKNVDSSGIVKCSSVRLWRWRLISKSYFYLGKLEKALELLRKHEQVKPIVDGFGDKSSETFKSFFVTIRELLRLKAAGNEAFQAGRHLEAVEHYTAALTCNTESRPFAAICFCNRAAAYQALGQITDAIADCSLAITLDASYPKAISRRATLREMIRDYRQAADDLGRLISLLEKQLTNKGNRSRSLGKTTNNNNDLNQARLRLSSVEEEARRETTLDMYMILGIECSSSAADVKRAYRKAALRHHPDKAGQFLARSENVDDGLWKEVADEVYTDADRLFKMIGEAYTVLSDPAKRLQYDAEEELRTSLKKGCNISRTPKTPADNHGSQYWKSTYRRWGWR